MCNALVLHVKSSYISTSFVCRLFFVLHFISFIFFLFSSNEVTHMQHNNNIFRVYFCVNRMLKFLPFFFWRLYLLKFNANLSRIDFLIFFENHSISIHWSWKRMRKTKNTHEKTPLEIFSCFEFHFMLSHYVFMSHSFDLVSHHRNKRRSLNWNERNSTSIFWWKCGQENINACVSSMFTRKSLQEYSIEFELQKKNDRTTKMANAKWTTKKERNEIHLGLNRKKKKENYFVPFFITFHSFVPDLFFFFFAVSILFYFSQAKENDKCHLAGVFHIFTDVDLPPNHARSINYRKKRERKSLFIFNRLRSLNDVCVRRRQSGQISSSIWCCCY